MDDIRAFGITGWKNSGKTTLMERLVTDICERGHTVSTLKHAHHNVDVDQPGKDSHRHRLAGAREVILASANRWALMHELRDQDEPPLEFLLSKLAPVDLVLVEGYKQHGIPKIEASVRPGSRPLLALDNSAIKAVAAGYQPEGLTVPVLDINDIPAIADFILARTGLAK